MALSATIWNPPLAVALVKTAIACIIARNGDVRVVPVQVPK
jgi:hypothetical protein